MLLAAAMLGGLAAVAATGPGARAAEAQVMIDNFSFSPAELTVAKGTHVTWTNRDDIPHTVTSRDDPHMLKSPALDTEDSFDYLAGRPVAALVYQRRQHVIDLFVWPDGRHFDRSPVNGDHNGYNVLRWRRDGMAFWAVSDLNAQELADVVRLWQTE